MSTLWRRQWHPTPVLLPGKSHGWRSLVGCSPWGREELDTTERLHFHFSLSCIGDGNGNPLQCSCLENPKDGGVWWAAIYGVAQSRTWLKWFSSSKCPHLVWTKQQQDNLLIYFQLTSSITNISGKYWNNLGHFFTLRYSFHYFVVKCNDKILLETWKHFLKQKIDFH